MYVLFVNDKRVDKGGVTVWRYEQTKGRQVGDTTFYVLLMTNPIQTLMQELQQMLTKARDEDLITMQELNFLFKSNPGIIFLPFI